MTEKSTDYILEQLGVLTDHTTALFNANLNAFNIADKNFETVSKVFDKIVKSNKRIKRFNRFMFIFSTACCAYAYFNEKKLNKIESEMKEIKSQKGD